MPSPFPGMDPYLETDKLWPVFHHQLVTCLYQILLPGLVDRYKARIGQRHYTTEQALFTSVVKEEHHEEYIEIRHRNETRLVTLIDVVSPKNKNTTTGRETYLNKRREGKSAGSSLVEIDLSLQGQPLLDYLARRPAGLGLCRHGHGAAQPDRYEIYTSTLQKRLPRFRLPLASDDRDTVVDLQVAFTRAFDQGNFNTQVDYTRDPEVHLNDEDRKWLHELLRQEKLRT